MPQLFFLFLALSAGTSHASLDNACPAALSKIFRIGQVVPRSERAAALREIRKHIFPGFVLAGEPHIDPLHETSSRDWPKRDHRIAGRLAYHEMEDAGTELVEADRENPLTAIQIYRELAGLPSAINFPADHDPLGLLRGMRNVCAAAGVALPTAYLCLESEPYPVIRFSVAVLTGGALAFAHLCHSIIRANEAPYPNFSDDHANLHARPERGAWAYSGVNLAYYIDQWHVAAMPFDAVSYVDEKGKPRTFFLVQPTPFRNYVEDNDSRH